MTHTVGRRSIIGLGIGLAAAVLAWVAGLTPFMETVELKTYDLRVRALADPRQASPDIVIVSISDASVRKLEPLVGRWPWPRLVHAQLIDFLSRAPAKVVAYDILFTEHDRRSFSIGDTTWTGEESDKAFAESVAKAGNVVLAADVTASDPLRSAESPANAAVLGRSRIAADPAFERRPALIPPYAALADAAAALGHNFVVLDPDGPVRRAVPAVRVPDGAVPSLALATALRATGSAPGTVRVEGGTLVAGSVRAPLVDADVPLADGGRERARRMLVRFTGPGTVGDLKPTYPEYSFYDLFYSEQQLQAGETPFVSPSA